MYAEQKPPQTKKAKHIPKLMTNNKNWSADRSLISLEAVQLELIHMNAFNFSQIPEFL